MAFDAKDRDAARLELRLGGTQIVEPIADLQGYVAEAYGQNNVL